MALENNNIQSYFPSKIFFIKIKLMRSNRKIPLFPKDYTGLVGVNSIFYFKLGFDGNREMDGKLYTAGEYAVLVAKKVLSQMNIRDLLAININSNFRFSIEDFLKNMISNNAPVEFDTWK